MNSCVFNHVFDNLSQLSRKTEAVVSYESGIAQLP